MPLPMSPSLSSSSSPKDAPAQPQAMQLSSAEEAITARTRHQEELDAINQQVALFVQQYTQHIQHSLLTLATAQQPPASPATPPQQASLDDILPPPPKPKRKQPAAAAAAPTADDGARDEGDEDVECDAYGVLIKRRRSKLPLRSVLQLRAWFAEHLQAPYPTDAQRDELAQRTKLTGKQVQNWFTNTRKRFWAPWVKRQQEARGAAVAADGQSSHDSQQRMSAESLAHVTFDGFSLQGS